MPLAIHYDDASKEVSIVEVEEVTVRPIDGTKRPLPGVTMEQATKILGQFNVFFENGHDNGWVVRGPLGVGRDEIKKLEDLKTRE